MSERIVLRFRIRPKRGQSAYGAKIGLADYLKRCGFEPGHWYANWKEMHRNQWLCFKNASRVNPKEDPTTVQLLLRDSAPNLAGTDLVVPRGQEEIYEKYIEATVIPYVRKLLDESGIPYEEVEE